MTGRYAHRKVPARTIQRRYRLVTVSGAVFTFSISCFLAVLYTHQTIKLNGTPIKSDTRGF
jgi:hypothetical protein